MLAGAIAQAYIELYRENALADIAHRSELQRQNIVDITRRRVSAGLDTQLEIREAEGQLPQARVARTQAQAAAQVAVHELATLTGQGAAAYSTIQRPVLQVQAALPVPKDLPINLLARRPDVLSARSLVQAADAERLASKAAFYPDVSLRALAGIGAFGMSNLVQLERARIRRGPADFVAAVRRRAPQGAVSRQRGAARFGHRRLQRHGAPRGGADRRSNHAPRRPGPRTDRSAANARCDRSRLQAGRGALSRRTRELPLGA